METIAPILKKQVDCLEVNVFRNRAGMGRTAGEQIAKKMKELLAEKEEIRMLFAAAPSQNEVLHYLAQARGIDWSRVSAFHMDEYIGLPENAPQKFGQFLCNRLFNHVSPGRVYLINGSNAVEEECKRYQQLIKSGPIDIVCLGIGENGHIAFNDPHVAEFNDQKAIKKVHLDDDCRKQQVKEGCFRTLDEVPRTALTLTIPVLVSGDFLYCVVPGGSKFQAVQQVLYGRIRPECPASVLRKHPHCILYLDQESYGQEE